MAIAHTWIYIEYATAGLAMTYGVIAWLVAPNRVARAASRSRIPTSRDMPPVTVLKPLCGADRDTYECLRSICHQEYPRYQVVFGVSDPCDPAIAVVRRLQAEFPHLALEIAVDRRQHGSNRKVSNLINMMALARHDFLILADSDVRVKRDYVARVIAPLLDRRVGIVTCPYRGVSREDLWSLLGSMFINEWFMPSVRVTAAAGSRAFAFGATIAIRRQVLASIGGFRSIADQLADDYRLGESTRRIGLRTVLSDIEVEICVTERSFGALVQHELRWLRTIRAVSPSGYGFSFITLGVPVTVLMALLARGAPAALGILAVTVLARVLLHLKARQPGSAAFQLLILPLRDILSFALWGWSFTTRRVRWRDNRYQIARDGSAQPVLRTLGD